MKVEYFKEYSHCLGRDMEFKVYGHGGKPCLALPCQNGRFFDYESRGLIDSISWYIEQGKIQVICVDSIDGESWSDEHGNPRYRIERQEAYFNYIINEIVPRIYQINNYGYFTPIMTYGCSMGAYHAVNFFLRKPDLFDSVLALSGIYKVDFFFKGYSDDLTFLNSPIDSFRAMSLNHYYLDMYRRSKVIICVGQGNWEEECIQNTKELEFQFKAHNCPAWFDYWGHDKPHDWPSWLEQTPYFLYHILD